MSCDYVYKNVFIIIQEQLVQVDFYLIPLAGANVVLGMQWMKTIGRILTDYNQMSMAFAKVNQLIKWIGDPFNGFYTPFSHRIKKPQPTG